MRYLNENKAVLILFFLLNATLYSQYLPSKNISIKDGLPNNQIESIFKDSRGILWVGTNNGLSAIENDHIQNFSVDDGLAHNSSWDIIEDVFGAIWIGSYGGGVTKFDGSTFISFDTSKGLTNNYVRTLFSYKGYVFVGTQDGLSFIDSKTSEVKTIPTEISDFQVMDFFVYKDQLYCCTFRKGIFKVDIANRNLEKVFDYEGKFLFKTWIENDKIRYSLENRDKVLSGTIREFQLDSLVSFGQESDLYGDTSVIWDFAQDNTGNLYAAGWGVHKTDGGVYQFVGNEAIHRNQDFGIESNNVRSLFYDAEFNFLYAGTMDKGLYRVDLNTTIQKYDYLQSDIIDVEIVKDKKFFLCKNGLNIAKNDRIISKITRDDFLNYALSAIQKFPDQYSSYVLKYFRVQEAENVLFHKIKHYRGALWMSNFLGIFKISEEGKILNFYEYNAQQFEFGLEGELFAPIPYSDFLVFLDYDKLSSTKNPNKITFQAADKDTPVDVTDYAKAEEGVYLSTENRGLFYYRNKNVKAVKIDTLQNELNLEHLAYNKDKKLLYIATLSGAVLVIDVREGFNYQSKLEPSIIRGNSILFLECYKDALLIGTELGLTVYREHRIQFFDKEQGIDVTNFSSSRIHENQLVITGDKTYYKVNLPELLAAADQKLDVNVRQLLINREPYQTERADQYFKSYGSEIALNYFENQLELDFITSNHPYPGKLEFRSRVNGLDTNWSKYTTDKTIYLPYLPAGTYDILVETTDLNSGEIFEKSLLKLEILPPFWETWWFAAIAVLILSVTMVTLHNKRLKDLRLRENKKAQIKRRIVETKMEALQSQMNPHFTFNAMNSIQNYIIDNDIDNALLYLSEFAKLIRKTLDNSSQPFISLAEEISYLKSYVALENMRFNNRVKVQFDYSDLELSEIAIPPMLIQPFIENAFVHAFKIEQQEPKLSILFKKDDLILTCIIEDNGIGIGETSSGQIHASKGMQLVKERLNLISNTLVNEFDVISEKNKGTKIVLRILFNDNY